MIVLIGVGSIAAVFLIWYVVVARPRRNAARRDEFMKAVEDLTRHLDTEVVPAAKQMSEAMQSLTYATAGITAYMLKNWTSYQLMKWAEAIAAERADVNDE